MRKKIGLEGIEEITNIKLEFSLFELRITFYIQNGFLFDQ